MPMEIHKERIKINEVLRSEYVQTTVEGDVIVPDINPDMFKILKVCANACITQKSIQQNRAYIQGIIRFNILYLPEDNKCGKLKSINLVMDFSHIFDIGIDGENMILSAEAECEKTEDNLINSRKVGIKCYLGINIKVMAEKETAAAISAEENSGLEIKTEEFNIINPTSDKDFEFTLKEELPLPPKKPRIVEILKSEGTFLAKEVKISDKKAALCGEVKLSVLYRGEDEGGEEVIECLEYTLPFTEAPSFEEFFEGMEGEAEFFAKSITVKTDPQKEESLFAEIVVVSTLRGFKASKFSGLTDAYGRDFNVQTKQSEFNIEKYLGGGMTQIPQKEIFELPGYLPDILKVCELSAYPVVSGVEISENAALVKGYIKVCALYITTSEELPVASFEESFDFSHTFDINDIKDGAICEAKASLEHISYTISGDRALSLRIITALSMKCMVSKKAKITEDIEIVEGEVLPKAPVCIYYVQEGDTLWGVAKKYRVPLEKLREDNDIENEELKTGKMIKIFR